MDVTEEQWKAVRRYFPAEEKRKPGRKGGRPWRDPREVLNGVLWVLRTGAPWGDLPLRYPPYQTCHRRFQKWVRDGVLKRVLIGLRKALEALGGYSDQEGFIDGTYVPAKKGALASENVAEGTQQRSSPLQTVMVFHSLSLLLKVPDTMLFSPTERSTPRSSMSFPTNSSATKPGTARNCRMSC